MLQRALAKKDVREQTTIVVAGRRQLRTRHSFCGPVESLPSPRGICKRLAALVYESKNNKYTDVFAQQSIAPPLPG